MLIGSSASEPSANAAELIEAKKKQPSTAEVVGFIWRPCREGNERYTRLRVEESRRWVPAFAGTTKWCAATLLHVVLLLAPAAGTAAHFALPGPSRPRRAGGGKVGRAIAGRRGASSTPVHGCTVGNPRSLLAKSRAQGCARDRDREGAFFFGYFLLGKQKKVTGDQGWSTTRTRT